MEIKSNENQSNNQQLLFLQGLLQSIKEGKEQQNKPLIINVREKHEGIPFQIEVYPNAKNCLPYRIINSGTGLWNTWEDNDQITVAFRIWGII